MLYYFFYSKYLLTYLIFIDEIHYIIYKPDPTKNFSKILLEGDRAEGFNYQHLISLGNRSSTTEDCFLGDAKRSS